MTSCALSGWSTTLDRIRAARRPPHGYGDGFVRTNTVCRLFRGGMQRVSRLEEMIRMSQTIQRSELEKVVAGVNLLQESTLPDYSIAARRFLFGKGFSLKNLKEKTGQEFQDMVQSWTENLKGLVEEIVDYGNDANNRSIELSVHVGRRTFIPAKNLKKDASQSALNSRSHSGDSGNANAHFALERPMPTSLPPLEQALDHVINDDKLEEIIEVPEEDNQEVNVDPAGRDVRLTVVQGAVKMPPKGKISHNPAMSRNRDAQPEPVFPAQQQSSPARQKQAAAPRGELAPRAKAQGSKLPPLSPMSQQFPDIPQQEVKKPKALAKIPRPAPTPMQVQFDAPPMNIQAPEVPPQQAVHHVDVSADLPQEQSVRELVEEDGAAREDSFLPAISNPVQPSIFTNVEKRSLTPALRDPSSEWSSRPASRAQPSRQSTGPPRQPQPQKSNWELRSGNGPAAAPTGSRLGHSGALRKPPRQQSQSHQTLDQNWPEFGVTAHRADSPPGRPINTAPNVQKDYSTTEFGDQRSHTPGLGAGRPRMQKPKGWSDPSRSTTTPGSNVFGNMTMGSGTDNSFGSDPSRAATPATRPVAQLRPSPSADIIGKSRENNMQTNFSQSQPRLPTMQELVTNQESLLHSLNVSGGNPRTKPKKEETKKREGRALATLTPLTRHRAYLQL